MVHGALSGKPSVSFTPCGGGYVTSQQEMPKLFVQSSTWNFQYEERQPTLIALVVCYKYRTFFPLLNLNCTKPSHSLFCKRKTKIVPNITPTTLRSKLLTCLTFRKKMWQRFKLFDAKCMKKRRRRRGILRAKN